MTKTRAAVLALALCLLSGLALALQWQGSSTNNVAYDGGSMYPFCAGATPIDNSANIAHILTVNATLTQNGVEPAEFAPGPADLAIEVTTNASIGRIISISYVNADRNAQASPAQGNLVFNSAEYNFMSGKYGDYNCFSKSFTSGSVDRGMYYLNWNAGNKQCDHTMIAADAVTVNIGYRSGIENGGCMTPAYDGMGKGYMYCTGGAVSVNGQNAGTLASNGQTFNTQVNLATGMTSIPVSVTYKCYFVVDLYLNTGQKQSLRNIIYAMPDNVPITQTIDVQIPIINPPQINLIPLIYVDGSIPTSNTITVTRNQHIPLTFWVNRTDTYTTIGTPQITWILSGTPIGLTPGTYPNWPLVPVLRPPTPSELITNTPQIITVCRTGGPGSETVRLEVNPSGPNRIIESSYNDNVITLTFICEDTSHQECYFTPTPLNLYAGETGVSTMRCVNSETGVQEGCGSLYSVTGPAYTQYFDASRTTDDSGTYRNWLFKVFAQQPVDQTTMFVDDQITAKPDSDSSGCTLILNWRRPDCRYYM